VNICYGCLWKETVYYVDWSLVMLNALTAMRCVVSLLSVMFAKDNSVFCDQADVSSCPYRNFSHRSVRFCRLLRVSVQFRILDGTTLPSHARHFAGTARLPNVSAKTGARAQLDAHSYADWCTHFFFLIFVIPMRAWYKLRKTRTF
jgi:hypothetical protein